MTSPVSARRFVIAVVIATLSIAVIGLLLVGYVARDSRRGLERELELLRASGAPEFPEQFEFPELPPGEDMVAWLHEIDQAEGEWNLEQLDACRPLASAPTFSAGEFELACDQALRDPRRVASLSECELAMLDARWESDRMQLELAGQIDRMAPVDRRGTVGKTEVVESDLLPSWPVAGALAAERVLCRDAARRARRGDTTGAMLRLRQALGLVERVGLSQTAVEFVAWTLLAERWMLDGLLPVLHCLPPESGLAEFLPQLERIDPLAQLRHGLIGERAQIQRVFRQLRSGRGGVEGLGSRGAGIDWLVTTLWFDLDQATYLGTLREVLAACDGGVDLSALRGVEQRLEELAGARLAVVRYPVTLMTCPKVASLGEAALRIEATLTLARAALMARDSGTLAAKSWLAGRRDPFDASPIRVRSDPDGILVLWSVGPDAREGPPEEGGFDDDVRILVRPRGF